MPNEQWNGGIPDERMSYPINMDAIFLVEVPWKSTTYNVPYRFD